MPYFSLLSLIVSFILLLLFPFVFVASLARLARANHCERSC